MINKTRGFTLIEMMIVLAILGVIAAIALPSYLDSIRKARRSDGGDALLYAQQLQEKYWASNGEFGSLVDIGYPNAATPPVLSSEGYYQITTTGDGNATDYTVTAAAVAGTSQASDTGNPVDCTSLTLTVTAANPRGTKGPAACWGN